MTKEEFYDKLKGPQVTVKVSGYVVEGAIITICNTGTADVMSCLRTNGKWMIWGSIGLCEPLSNADFEIWLSEQRAIAEKENGTLRITDDNGYLLWYAV